MFPRTARPPMSAIAHIRVLETLEARITPQAGALNPGYGIDGIWVS